MFATFLLGLLGGPTIQEFTRENRFQKHPAVISSTSTIFRCLEKKIQNIAMCSSSHLSLTTHDLATIEIFLSIVCR